MLATNVTRNRQLGLSLIEMMIAMVVGLLVILAITNLVVSGQQSSRSTLDVARLQEAARFGFDVLGVHARLAGFHRDGPKIFDSTSATCAASERQAVCGWNATGPNASDELVVRFYGVSDAAGAADNGTFDCAGNAINEGAVIEERFRIENVLRNPGDATSAVPTLVCRVITGAANIQAAPNVGGADVGVLVPLVFGVTTMQILFGEDTNVDTQADQWRPAGVANMSQVSGARISLLVASEREPATETDTNTYQLFGPDYPAVGDGGANFAAAGDKRIRKIVNIGVGMRNRI